ncbi:nucleotidyltransferase [Aquimarina algiphila]|uniref:Nucleotidyltransferase n=1 Tax=Aquimarina algiphila TaxID=2047982 RepID=A0A554VEY7_9FLAO|nr:nucleotidyltransferase [Aquimarina algiphila]TSE05683.1 nucleotidyltransferase [Aquimarina algiphila]
MARTLNDIQQSILDKKTHTVELGLKVLTINEQSTLTDLTSTSKVAIWRLWVYIVAFAIWTLEKLFDIHIIETDKKIAENEIHNFLWYKKKALLFQYGHALVSQTDYYNNSDIEVSEILKSKIIKHVAVIRKIINGHGFLELKLAKEENGQLVPLTTPEMEAFKAYMFLVADAGTYIQYISLPHDSLKLVLEIQYDPQILWQDGTRKDGTDNTPVINAINEFLYTLEFNGELILTKLTDYLQNVEGVKIPKIRETYSKYGNFDYEIIDETYIARAGYMRLDLDNTIINYIPREL